MTPERYERIREIFLAARDRASAERAAFLEQCCESDQQLRQEVESLLASEQVADTFLRTPALGAEFAVGQPESLLEGETRVEQVAEPDTGPGRIGPYRILGILGQGGMGVVYRAQQDNPRRIVALKVIRPGVESPETLKRFEHESQVLGWLQHPGIAQIFEAGTAQTAQGRQPFFAMEFVEGQPLSAYAAARDLGIRARLELLAKVCDAVHHAHQKGVIHRDLKPSNILVDAGGQPKVVDFGVARITDADIRTTTLQTQTGQIIGTMAYISPEQVAGEPDQLDTRADVYALGVILFELLTGQVPLDVARKTLPQAARTITEEEPPTLSSVNRALRGDLDAILNKALEKDKRHRYQSASDLAADIRRYLADVPIMARPVTTFYQLRKFARRNKSLVFGLAGIFLVLVVGTIVSTWLAIRATNAEVLAQKRYELAEMRRAEAAMEATRASAFGDFLLSMLGHISPEIAQGRDDSLLRVVLDSAAEEIGAELAEYPDVQASIHQVIGRVYLNISRWDQAREHLQAAYEVRSELLGPNHPETLASLSGLAQVHWKQNKLEQAEAMYDDLIARYRSTLGDHDRLTLIARYDRAGVLKDRGRLDEVEHELRDLIVAMREHLNSQDDAIFEATNGLAVLALDKDQTEKAEELFRDVLRHWTEKYGPRHPKRLSLLQNLATAVKHRGDLPAAEELSRQSLALAREVYGEDHHATIQTLINLASLLFDRDQLAEAEELARQALAKAERILGSEHPDTLKAISHLGLILRNAGEFEEACTYLERAAEISEKLHGPHDSRTLNCLSSLAGLYYERRELEKSEKIMRRVVAGLEAAQGESSFSVLAARTNLGSLLIERENFAEAEEILQKTIRLTDQVAPPGHWFRWSVRMTYGQCLLKMERYEQAEKLLLECYDNLNKSLGPEHQRTRTAAGHLVNLYEAWGRPEEAARYTEAAGVSPEPADSPE
ncbi:MAG: tetratricopeptide repeat protein [Planctomycetota bacterium]